MRAADRLALGRDAVLTVRVAAGLLPVSDEDAVRWIHERGLVCTLGARAVVVWGDVLDALRAERSAELEWMDPSGP
jgi:hypothetical protein